MAGRIVIYCHVYQPEDRKTEGKQQHILGRMVLKQALINEYQIEFTEDMLEIMEGGKPILRTEQEQPSIHFNISHCKGLVVCAISESCSVGIDVETHRKITDSIMRKVCNQQELKYILNHDYIWSFLRFWTLKESYVKMTGEGMRVPLNTVNFQFTEDGIRSNHHGHYYQKQLKIEKLNVEYIISLCTKEKCEEPKLILI